MLQRKRQKRGKKRGISKISGSRVAFRARGMQVRLAPPLSPLKEIKNRDLSASAVDVTATSVGVHSAQLCILTQGTNNNQRIGRRVNLTSFQMKMFMFSQTGTGPYIIRILVVQQTDVSGSAITLNTVLQNTGNDNQAIVSPYNLDRTNDYNVLFDKVYTGSEAQSNDIIADKMFIRFPGEGISQLYSAAGGSLTTLQQNNLNLFAISTSPALTAPQLAYFARTRYYG